MGKPIDQVRYVRRPQHGYADDADGSVTDFLRDVEGWTAARLGRGDPSAISNAVDFFDCCRVGDSSRSGPFADQCTWKSGQYRDTFRIHHRLRGRLDSASHTKRYAPAVPNSGRTSCPDPRDRPFVVADGEPPARHLDPPFRLAHHWFGDLFRLRPPPQPPAGN